MKKLLFFILFIFCLIPVAAAQLDSSTDKDREILELKQEVKELRSEFRQMQEKYGSVIDRLQTRIEQLEGGTPAAAVPPQVYDEKLNNLQAKVDKLEQGRGGLLQGKWNPEIGVVGDVVFRLDSAKTDEEGADRVSLRELELILGSAVDPYSRFDATIAFSDSETPSLEEAYLTHFGLPLQITGRLGKFKPKIGKALSVHRDSLETVDEPLVIQKYFGIEGFNKSGMDFSKILDIPWPVTQQVALGALQGGNGEEGTAFGETERRPTIYSHLKNYVDLFEDTGLELGFSHMAGSRDEDEAFEVQVLGVDATLTQHFNASQSLKLQSEVFNLNRKETEDLDGNVWGLYGLADLRFHPRWSTGFRYDYVQPVDNSSDNPRNADKGYTGYLTFNQSEFARWRLQFTHTDLATGANDNQVMLQGTFSIGEHKHKVQ